MLYIFDIDTLCSPISLYCYQMVIDFHYVKSADLLFIFIVFKFVKIQETILRKYEKTIEACNRNPSIHINCIIFQSLYLMKYQEGLQTSSQIVLECKFSLKRLEITKQGRVIEVDFSPVLSKKSNNLVNVVPIFNRDKKQHMPSFMIPSQMENYEEHEKIYLSVHQKKVMEAEEEKEQIFVPKPSKKNSCCCICRTLYDDYLTHITTLQHQALMEKSQFNDDISELCLRFATIKRTTSAETNDQDEQFNKNPKKKIKIQSTRKTRKRHQESGISTMIDSGLIHRNIPENIV